MILIFAGTTEGKIAAQVCDSAGKHFYISTLNNSASVESTNGQSICGAMDAEAIADFVESNEIRLIIDAAHPHAKELHKNIAQVSYSQSIDVIRFERGEESALFADYQIEKLEDCIKILEDGNFKRPLFLTGVKSAEMIQKLFVQYDYYLRIMERPESLKVIDKCNFEKGRVLFWDGEALSEELLSKISPDVIITKESGANGMFEQKLKAARKHNIRVISITRPQLPTFYSSGLCDDTIVYGKHTLRRAIEKIIPDFFPLKTGLTTGTCATAAAKGALQKILFGSEKERVEIILPNRERVTVKINSYKTEGSSVTCECIKESGDDPDITNGISILATVTPEELPGVRILGGAGVGKVTLPGLGLKIGAAAINKTPLEMISHNLNELFGREHTRLEYAGATVVISVPEGERIASKTFNPRLGIEGGISIIGTSGVVKPFSSEAFAASIATEMRVARAQGIESVILNSGAKSEAIAKSIFSKNTSKTFIQYGNLIGESVKNAFLADFSQVLLVVLIGKGVKLAEGHLDTHSKISTFNRDFIFNLAQDCGVAPEILAKIQELNTARELLQLIPPKTKFYRRLTEMCKARCIEYTKKMADIEIDEKRLTIVMTDEFGNML